MGTWASSHWQTLGGRSEHALEIYATKGNAAGVLPLDPFNSKWRNSHRGLISWPLYATLRPRANLRHRITDTAWVGHCQHRVERGCGQGPHQLFVPLFPYHPSPKLAATLFPFILEYSPTHTHTQKLKQERDGVPLSCFLGPIVNIKESKWQQKKTCVHRD